MRNGIALLFGITLAAAPLAKAAASPPQPGALRQAELVRLVREDCGSCHGSRLTGGLGPALTPEALRAKPDDALIQTILQGRPGTPMPPWNPFLSMPEVAWIIDELKKGFPDAH